MKQLLLLLPLVLLLAGCSNTQVIIIDSEYTGTYMEYDYCSDKYERCIDNYFSDKCIELYRDWSEIMCKLDESNTIPIRQFMCNPRTWCYWIPINL